MSSQHTASRTLSLASVVVALWAGALTPGGSGAAVEILTQTSTTTTAPDRQEPNTATASTTTAPPAPTTTTVTAETSAQHEMAQWALQRFEEAGLELPAVTIYMHDDRAGCRGRLGYLGHGPDTGYEIHHCGVEFTLLHELAHAWDIHALTDGKRKEFLEVAEATQWNNADDWHMAGGEHAANVIAWALMPERINQTQTRPYDPASMTEGLLILTGGEPLWG